MRQTLRWAWALCLSLSRSPFSLFSALSSHLAPSIADSLRRPAPLAWCVRPTRGGGGAGGCIISRAGRQARSTGAIRRNRAIYPPPTRASSVRSLVCSFVCPSFSNCSLPLSLIPPHSSMSHPIIFFVHLCIHSFFFIRSLVSHPVFILLFGVLMLPSFDFSSVLAFVFSCVGWISLGHGRCTLGSEAHSNKYKCRMCPNSISEWYLCLISVFF